MDNARHLWCCVRASILSFKAIKEHKWNNITDEQRTIECCCLHKHYFTISLVSCPRAYNCE